MKTNLRLIFTAAIALSVSFISCKKIDKTDNNTELATHSDDQARVASETDAVANDANTVAAANSEFGRPGDVTDAPCDATAVFATGPATKTITITYNGTNCSGTRTRTGVVVLSIPNNTHWGDQGAVLTINVQNLKITRLIDNKSITINGIETVTNVTGGRLIDLSSGTPIIHDLVSTGITVTFDDGSQRIWQMAKRRTFTYSNGIVISTVGNHTEGSTTGISEWGTNRFGSPFTTSITEPMVIRQDCAFRLVSGQVTHHGLIANVVATFGLDATGNPTTCPTGYYYFKIIWTANSIVRTFIYPY